MSLVKLLLLQSIYQISLSLICPQIHIFVNQETMDFQDIEDYPALEKRELEWDVEDLSKNTNKIVLAGPKFQRAQSLQVFFVDAKDDAPYCFLNHVGITGTIAPDYHTK